MRKATVVKVQNGGVKMGNDFAPYFSPFEVGSSIGAFYFAPAGDSAAIMRLSGNQKWAVRSGDAVLKGSPADSVDLTVCVNGEPVRYFDVIEGEHLGEVSSGQYLMAASAGAARNGLFHRVHRPQNAIEEYLCRHGVSARAVARVERIDDATCGKGGALCSHLLHGGHGEFTLTDGKVELVQEGEVVGDDHFNQHHRGCQCSPDTVKVTGGSFLVKGKIGSHPNGSRYHRIEQVQYTGRFNACSAKEMVAAIEKQFFDRADWIQP